MGAKLSTKQHESKLLSTVLKSLDPKIANETWDEIAQAMGSGYTAESVRIEYEKIMGKGAASEHQEVAPTSQQKDTPTTVPVAKHQETASYNQQKAIPVAIPEADHEEIVSTRHINATSTTAESGTVAQPLPSRAGNSRSVDDMMMFKLDD